jgi:hypothetical protein
MTEQVKVGHDASNVLMNVKAIIDEVRETEFRRVLRLVTPLQAIKTFDCPTCGETKIDGQRVSIVSALPPDAHAAFSATTR